MKKTCGAGSEWAFCLAENHSEIRRCAVWNVSKSLLSGDESMQKMLDKWPGNPKAPCAKRADCQPVSC